MTSLGRGPISACALALVAGVLTLASPAYADDPALSGAAFSPASVAPGLGTTLTVTVTPGTAPVSASNTVTADLSALRGPSSAALLDNGTNGDATAGDGVYSVAVTPALDTPLGSKSIPVTVTDSDSRTATTTATLDVVAPPSVTVNTTDDSVNAGACATTCSLRDAVAVANTTPGTEIKLPAGNYVLNTQSTPLGELSLNLPTTITGAGARTTTIDAGGESRVFNLVSFIVIEVGPSPCPSLPSFAT